jgi:membrane-bound ClpP family serine protease
MQDLLRQGIPTNGVMSLSLRLFLRSRTMPLVNLIVTLVVVGVILWLINNYIPMDGTIKKILNVVVIIVVILWLLSAFGILGDMSAVRVG